MTQMLFMSAVVNAFDENTDPFHARYLATLNQDQRYTTTFAQVKTHFLATSGTATITTTSTWRLLAVKVVGEVEVVSAGVDAAASPIAGRVRVYGTSLYPGWLIWNVSGLTSDMTITALSDDTIVEVFNATLEADA